MDITQELIKKLENFVDTIRNSKVLAKDIEEFITIVKSVNRGFTKVDVDFLEELTIIESKGLVIITLNDLEGMMSILNDRKPNDEDWSNPDARKRFLKDFEKVNELWSIYRK